MAKSYTVLVYNEALGTSRFVGTWDDEEKARDYARLEASRSRVFTRWEVWTGTPRNPGSPTKFQSIRGEK